MKKYLIALGLYICSFSTLGAQQPPQPLDPSALMEQMEKMMENFSNSFEFSVDTLGGNSFFFQFPNSGDLDSLQFNEGLGPGGLDRAMGEIFNSLQDQLKNMDPEQLQDLERLYQELFEDMQMMPPGENSGSKKRRKTYKL